MADLFENKKFEIQIEGLKIVVVEHTVNQQQIFRLSFSDGRPPLVISNAVTWGGNIWTSIPQGRQKEAELFGAEIVKHLKNQ